MRNGLLKLHKTLLDSESAHYEREVARIPSRARLLELVLEDPWFAWLRELSELIVLIDETREAKEGPTATDAERLIRRTVALLQPAEDGRGFARSYFEAIQRDPDVVLAHGEMRQVLGRIDRS